MKEINVSFRKPLRSEGRAREVLFKHNKDTNMDGYGEGYEAVGLSEMR